MVQTERIDIFLNFVTDALTAATLIDNYKPLIDKYAQAVKQYDPEGLTEDEEVEIVQDACTMHKQEVFTIKGKAFKAVCEYLETLDQSTFEEVMNRDFTEWITNDDEVTNRVIDILKDTIKTEYGKVLPVWLAPRH